MDDRRRAERHTVLDLQIHLKDDQNPLGKVINISENGMMVTCEKPLEEQTSYLFRIPFNTNAPKMIHFDFEARVVWAKENTETAAPFSMGLEYLNYHDLQSQFIHHMVELYGKAETNYPL